MIVDRHGVKYPTLEMALKIVRDHDRAIYEKTQNDATIKLDLARLRADLDAILASVEAADAMLVGQE